VYPKIPSSVTPFATTGIVLPSEAIGAKSFGLSPPAHTRFATSANLTHFQWTGILKGISASVISANLFPFLSFAI
jgi:hypothetical protein